MGVDLMRIARNEAIFRNVNERIAESAQRFEADATEFVCECGDHSCTHRIEASLDDYERVRQSPTRFMLAPGHAQKEVERVVDRKRQFWIVEKVERTVAATVRRLNPRAGTT